MADPWRLIGSGTVSQEVPITTGQLLSPLELSDTLWGGILMLRGRLSPYQ
jgi:hypothetical protein